MLNVNENRIWWFATYHVQPLNWKHPTDEIFHVQTDKRYCFLANNHDLEFYSFNTFQSMPTAVLRHFFVFNNIHVWKLTTLVVDTFYGGFPPPPPDFSSPILAWCTADPRADYAHPGEFGQASREFRPHLRWSRAGTDVRRLNTRPSEDRACKFGHNLGHLS